MELIRQGEFGITKAYMLNYSFTNCVIRFLTQKNLKGKNYSNKLAIVKEYVLDRFPENYSGTDAEMVFANNFIMPEIAKQFELDAAEYYNVIFEDCEELKNKANYRLTGKPKIISNKRYLLTPLFNKEDEELIHLGDVLNKPYERNLSTMINDIEIFLKRRNYNAKDIIQVKKEFIKQSIFNKYIGYTDEHNMNAGIIVKNENNIRRVRLAPCYDLDFSAGVYNVINNEVVPRAFFRVSDDKKNDLISTLNQFKEILEKNYLNRIIQTINIEEAIKNGEENGDFKLSKQAIRKYKEFFAEKQKELESFYNENYIKKIKDDNYEQE